VIPITEDRDDAGSRAAERRELLDLRARLAEAEQTLDAIRNGEVDAVVVGSPAGQLVYTLENADRPYRVLIEQMQEGAVTLGDDGTVLYCNQRFATILGVPRETILGRGVEGFLRDDEASTLKAMIEGTIGKPRAGEFTFRAADGNDIPVNVSLVDLKIDDELTRVICGVVTDLTHNRRRAEEVSAANRSLENEIGERRRVEESLRLALDAAEMGDWEIDVGSGTVGHSLRHDEIFGHPQGVDPWTLADAIEHFLPEDRDSVTEAFAAVEAQGSLDFERRIERASDQSVRWLHVRGRAYYENGRVDRIAGVVSDVTEQRALEEQLRQAQKMEAVGQLTGGLAHDFNNLLTGISGSLELLQLRTSQGRTGPELQRYVVAAQGAATRAAGLTHRLLAFARRQTLAPRATDVNLLIRDMAELLRRTIGPACVLEVDEDAALWPALVDGNQLESALLNLCINARDAMPDGGRITIRTSNHLLAPRVAREHDLTPGEYLSISVIDTGTGMSKATMDRAFDPFFTTKPIGAGTGLGLSMVYGFARQSSGQIAIESEIDRGTTMRIYLPRHAGTVDAEAEQARAPGSLISRNRETVLVVDDEPTVRMLVMEVLDDLNYKAIEANDGPSGLRLLQSRDRIDLLITDVGLPGAINGRQVADAGRVLRPDLKVLFITGYADHAVIGEGQLDSGMEILMKPFTLETLGQRIKAMIACAA